MGQYLNFVGTDFRISLSFSRQNLQKLPYLQEAIYSLLGMVKVSEWCHCIAADLVFHVHSKEYQCLRIRTRHVTLNFAKTASCSCKMTIFKIYLLLHFLSYLEFDCGIWIYGTISRFCQAGFSIFAFVFASRDFKVGQKSLLTREHYTLVTGTHACKGRSRAWYSLTLGLWLLLYNLPACLPTARLPAHSIAF